MIYEYLWFIFQMDGLLSDAQIHQFISSTVLPHHRTLTRTGLVSFYTSS